MKKNLFITLLITALCFSCGPAIDDNNLPNQVEIEDHLKPFVGYWDADKKSYRDTHEWYFAPDKTCQYFVADILKGQGVWDFNPTTSILATTIESNQWTVTLTSDNSWAGVCLDGSNSSIAFNRLSDAKMAKYAIVGSWEGESGEKITYTHYQKFSDFSQWGNVSSITDNWKLCYHFCRFSEWGEDYDGVVLRLNGRCYVDDYGDILGYDTLTMYLTDGCIMNKFLCKKEKAYGNDILFHRVELTAEEK